MGSTSAPSPSPSPSPQQESPPKALINSPSSAHPPNVDDIFIKMTTTTTNATTTIATTATAPPPLTLAKATASASATEADTATAVATKTLQETDTLEPTRTNSATTSITASESSRELILDLRRQLELRDQEIQVLKFVLEKYKLALHQSQLDYRLIQQHQHVSENDNILTDDNDDFNNLLEQTHICRRLEKTQQTTSQASSDLIGNLINNDGIARASRQQDRLTTNLVAATSRGIEQDSGLVVEHSINQPRIMHLVEPKVTTPNPKTTNLMPTTSRRVVVPRANDDDENDEAKQIAVREKLDETINAIEQIQEHHIQRSIQEGEDDDNLDDIIQDVGEIDLSLELDEVADSKKRAKEKDPKSGSALSNGSVATEEEEDIISDGLLTSLTDAAISNLSQLAALQERCESQQHTHQYQSSSQQQQQQQQQTQVRPQSSSSNLLPSHSNTSVTSGGANLTGSPIPSAIALGVGQQQAPSTTTDFTHDPFSTSSIANQAAIAINAAAVAHSHSQQQQTQPPPQQQISSSSSISPDSTIQADCSSNSLASVVAAAAAAAAAANDQQIQHHQPHHHHQLNPQSRLISSAITSPDFYHSLHQQHPHHAQQQKQQQQQNQQQQHHHQHSPVSSLHFSPSTSVTPSPSSLMASSRRSAASNTSSSLISPISSPNYLRRQFMPDRIPLLSPSPTSGLATGSSSAASTSLAHILHQQNQQRSASALAGGPIASTSSTPLSSTGSTAVSPLMNNKNSSQARLNNMQIRHKFGYLGSGRAQFNSPHGFCLGLNQEIVVADTNNHRVCIFDKSGTYITQFGSPGKEEGQLWNPRKVAILHRPIQGTGGNSNTSHQQNQQISSPYSSHISNNNSSNSNIQQSTGQLLGSTEPLYVVCDRGAERSRMQLFTKDGAFIKKIGIHYIDIVAGLAITQNGLIIVVDSVSPTVYIINGETGILNGWFDCSGYMKEPSDIAVKSDVPGNEYFICDFKGHCVVVFSEQGEYLRKIGHDGLTSYPNGIDISDDGDILVGDSHGNRFHVVVFDRNGK